MRQRYLLDFSSCIIITRLYICVGGMRLSKHVACDCPIMAQV